MDPLAAESSPRWSLTMHALCSVLWTVASWPIHSGHGPLHLQMHKPCPAYAAGHSSAIVCLESQGQLAMHKCIHECMGCSNCP
eukprot:2748749-Amphidinium_carterae.1